MCYSSDYWATIADKHTLAAERATTAVLIEYHQTIATIALSIKMDLLRARDQTISRTMDRTTQTTKTNKTFTA